MDRQDVAILAHLFQDPRASYEDVGGHVRLSANAVKARLRRLQESGVLQGVAATPAPSLLGLQEGLLVFSGVEDAHEREADILSGLPDVPGVRFVDLAHDHSVHAWIWWRDEDDWERIERAAISLVGKPPTHRLRPARTPHRGELTSADWRIARAILGEGRAHLKDLSVRAGMSFKTAKRRLAHLLREGHLRLEPVLSPMEASGLVLYTLVLLLKEGAPWEPVARRLPAGAIVSREPGSRFVLVHAACDTLREVFAEHRRLSGCPQLEHAFLSIATRRATDAMLAEAIAHRLGDTPTPHPAPMPVPLRAPK